MVGSGDGAGQLPVQGRPTTLAYGRAGASCACSRCGTGGLFFVLCFPSRLSYLPPVVTPSSVGFYRPRPQYFRMFSHLPTKEALEKEERIDEMKKIFKKQPTRPASAASTAGPRPTSDNTLQYYSVRCFVYFYRQYRMLRNGHVILPSL